MNRRSITVAGLAAAAVVGTAVPSWAFWTLTSDPTSTAGAKANELVAAHAQAGRNGKSGVNATITIRLGAGIADRFTVYRGPDLVCLNKPADQVCEETGSNNSGDKTYTITQYVGTNWVSSVTTCVFKNNEAVADPSSVNCSPLTNPIAPLTAGRMSAPAGTTTDSKVAPTPTPTPEPSPTPAAEAPAPVAEEQAEQPTEQAAEQTETEPTPAPGEKLGAEMGAGVDEDGEPVSQPTSEPTADPTSEPTSEGSTEAGSDAPSEPSAQAPPATTPEGSTEPGP